ncbi:MAG: hypothetical protein Q8P20_07940 [bacterium]|nr:hypothetical protein [bacterium]
MTKKRVSYSYIVLFAIALFFVSAIDVLSAPSLVVTPSSINVESNMGEQKIFSVNIKNNDTLESIYNVSFAPLNNYNFPFIPFVSPGQSLDISFNYLSNNVHEGITSTLISFVYIESINNQPSSYDVFVNDTDWNPKLITIKQGDTIIWKNQGLLSHSAIAIDNAFNINIPINGSSSKIFNDVGNYIYFDPIFQKTAQITVQENINQISVHNSNLDKTLSFNEKVTSINSSVDFNFFDGDINMIYNSSEESAIVIQNNANVILTNVSVSDSLGWLNFTANNFTINPLSSKILVFNIIPNVTSTSDTNKTYTTNVRLISSNGLYVNHDLNIFLQYSDIDMPLDDSIEALLERIRGNATFEEQLDAILRIIRQQKNETLPEIIFIENDTFSFNFSKRDLYNLNELTKNNSDLLIRVTNELSSNREAISNNEGNSSLIAQILNTLQEDINDNKAITGWIIATLVIAVICGLSLFFYKKFKNNPSAGVLFQNEDE